MPAESLLNFVENYSANGNEIAVRQRRGYRTESWTYRRIAEEANRVARELESRRIHKGDAVLLWAENSAEWMIAFLGCLISGVVVVPIDHASSAEFACRVFREVNAKLVFGAEEGQSCRSITSISLESLCSVISRHDSSPYPSPALSRQDTLQIIFTSGTTAEPRGVVITHGNVLANIEPMENEIRKYRRYEKLVHPVRFLNLLPLSHVFGQMLGLFIPPMLSGTVVFAGSLKPNDVVDTIRRERVSVFVAVPRFIESLRREVERREEREGRIEEFRKNFIRAETEHFLRRWWRFRRTHSRLGWKFWGFISGGAALSGETETFWNRLGFAVIQGYGMTETTSLISLNHPFRSNRGSIGKVFPGMEVRVDENGEILVRGENVATAYQQRGEKHSLAEPDGWFRTGDIAERDESGRLYFKGRRKNVIVTSSGMNVYPEDLENALRAQPEIRDCVVVGIEGDKDELPCAALLLNSANADPASAVERANRTLAEYQKVRQWVVWPDPDFPRTPTQKPILPRIRETLRAVNNGSIANTAAQESLSKLLTRLTGRDVQLDSNASLEKDLQLTSLDRVELMSVLEQQHQVELSDARFQDITTVGQLQQLVADGTSSPVPHTYPQWPQSWPIRSLRLVVYYLLAWPATYLLAAPRVRGRENLKGLRGPVLVISNHVTYLDIAWILPALPRTFRNRLATAMGGERIARMRRPSAYLSAAERFLERLRYVLVTSLFNVFPLPQRSGFLQSFNFAGDLVERGWSVLVFPEGQTTDKGNMLPFRPGIGLLAARLNVPVIPMHIDGLFDLKKERRVHARPGHVRVTIGKPARFTALQSASEITEELERRVRELQSA